MKDWHGVTYHSVKDTEVREAISTINDFLFQLSPSIGRISRGLQPNSSGQPIISVDGDFWFKPGVSNFGTAFMGKQAGDSGIISSTKHGTKGFVYLGSADGLAFDETNTLVGLNVPTPAARIDMEVGAPESQFSRPTNSPPQIGGGWRNELGGLTLTDRIDEVIADDADFIQESGGATPCNLALTSVTNPNVTDGHVFRFRYQNPSAINTIGTFTVTLYDSGGNIKVMTITSIPPLSGWVNAAYTLSAGEVALIDYSSLGFAMSTAAVSGIQVSWVEFEVPGVGGGSPTDLQRWATPATENILTFTSDGAGTGGLDLSLTGTPALRISSGGGSSGLRLLTSSTNGRIEVGTSAQANMNLVMSGARDATGTLLTQKFSNTTLTGTITINGGSPASGRILESTDSNGLARWSTLATLGIAPSTASYVTIGAESGLTAERVLTGTATRLSVTDNGANSTVVLDVVTNNLLDANLHGDTANEPVAEGSLVYGNNDPKWAALPRGTANQVLGVLNDASNLEYKTIQGTSNEINVTHSAGAITIGIVDPLIATKGGTGLALYAVGDILTADTTTTLSRLADVATGNALISGGVGVIPSWGKIDLTTHVTGDLPFSNLAQIAGLSVLGVTGSSTADVAAITAANDHEVLRRSGTSLTFGAVNLASSNAVTGDLPYANLTQASGASQLLGRGSAAGAGDWQDITLGTGLSMSGTVLSGTAAATFATPSANSVNVSAPTAGSGTDAIRATATLQLDQSIAPVWTGVHAFHNQVVIDTSGVAVFKPTPLAITIDSSSADDDQYALVISDTNTGTDYFILGNTTAGLPAGISITLPADTGTLLTTAGVMGTSGGAITNSTTVGWSLRDTTTASKRLRFVLSGASASTNSAFAITSTGSRTFTMLDSTGTVPLVVAPASATVDKTGQTAAIGATTVFTTTHAGRYRMSAYVVITAFTTLGTITVDATWTDPVATNTNVSLTTFAYTAVNQNNVANGTTTAQGHAGTIEFYATSGSNIQFRTTFSGTATYSVYVRVEDLS